MPIKKTKKTVAEVKSKIANKFEDDAVSNAIIKKYGNIIENGNKVLEDLTDYEIISFSPALDLALGGGIREGTVVAMTGDPKTGKTTSALYFAAKCQKLGKKVFYYNTEDRMTKENFTGIKGLDPAAIKIVQTSEEQPIISAEDYLNSLEMHIKGTPGFVAIIDSVSNMLPKEELEGDVRSGVRNGLPRLLAMFFKRMSGVIRRNKAILIFITHNIANTGGSPHAPKKHADTGNMLQYQASTNMVITHRGPWEVPEGNPVGQVVNWIIKTSAAGGIPNTKAVSWLRYGIGLDEAQELAFIATEFSLIKRNSPTGAYYIIQSLVADRLEKSVAKFLKSKDVDPENEEAVIKLLKFHGMANLTDFLTENEFVIEFLNLKIKEMLS